MKKLKIVALVVACALVLSGCSLLSVDQNRIQQQVVATVNGVQITRHQVEQATAMSDYYQQYMQYYGFTEKDLTENPDVKSWYQELLSSMLDQLVMDEVLVQKAPGVGVTLTDEEKQEQRTAADAQFDNIKYMIRTQVEEEYGVTPSPTASPSAEASPAASVSPAPTASPAASASASAETSPAPSVSVDQATIDAEVERRYQETIAQAEYTPDQYYEYLCRQKLITKMLDYIKGLAVVTDEDVRTWYDETLAAQQQEMDADPTVFAKDMNSNLICTYVPEDTIAVKQVMMKYKDADLSEVAQKLYNDGKKEEAMELLQTEIAALTPTLSGVRDRLAAGEDIQTLIDEYNEDPGMTQDPYKNIGYLVGASTTTYVDEFKNAALALKNIGDVSAPVASNMGIHVLQVINIYKKGVVSFEQLRDQIKTALLPGKQNAKYTEMTDQWKSEAAITYDRDRLYN